MKNLLEIACERFGKRGLSKRLGLSEAAIYLALKERRELRPEHMESIRALLSDTVEKPREETQMERMIGEEVHKLPQDKQEKVYRYCIELQLKEIQ